MLLEDYNIYLNHLQTANIFYLDNPQGTSLYKNGLNGYDSRLRNKDAYRQAYRQAFLQGFDDGYNRNYNRNNRNNRNRYGSGNSVRRIILGY